MRPSPSLPIPRNVFCPVRPHRRSEGSDSPRAAFSTFAEIFLKLSATPVSPYCAVHLLRLQWYNAARRAPCRITVGTAALLAAQRIVLPARLADSRDGARDALLSGSRGCTLMEHAENGQIAGSLAAARFSGPECRRAQRRPTRAASAHIKTRIELLWQLPDTARSRRSSRRW